MNLKRLFIKRSKVALLGAIVLSIIYLFFIVRANIQLVDHPYAWSVDEISDMDTIYKIHEISTFSELYRSFIQNQINDIHGAITIYIPALISIVPNMLWGGESVIFSFRMTAALLLLGSILILSFGFTRKNLLNFSLLFFLISIPYTGMFMTWPRCESYLHLFYTLFLWIQFRTEYKSNIAFSFLGMALISRISIAIYIPWAFILPMVLDGIRCGEKGQRCCRKIIVKTTKRILFFWIGIVIAEPYLLLPKNVLAFIGRKRFLIYQDTGVKEWIDFKYWMREVPSSYFGNIIIFYIVISIMLLAGSIILIQRKKLCRLDQSSLGNGNIVFYFGNLVISVAGILLIALEVKMDTFWYWHFYLCIGVASLIFLIGTLRDSCRTKGLNAILLIISSLFLINYLREAPFISHQLKIEKSKPFLTKLDEYKQSRLHLEDLCRKVDRKIHVRILADQFQLNDSSCFKIHPFWNAGPFYKITSDVDVIFFDYQEFKPDSKYNKQKDGDWYIKKESEKNYRKLVIGKWGGQCKKQLECFDGKMVTDRIMMMFRKYRFKH